MPDPAALFDPLVPAAVCLAAPVLAAVLLRLIGGRSAGGTGDDAWRGKAR